MRDWKDFDSDGEVDRVEEMMAEEMLCTSREEHEALFGDAGDFDDLEDFDDVEFDDDLFELDSVFDDMDLDDMDFDDISDALEDAGLDPDDFDFD